MRGKKGGLNITNYVIGMLMFSLFIVAPFLVVTQSGGLWDKFGVDSSNVNVTSYNKIQELGQEAERLSCKIDPETNSEICTEENRAWTLTSIIDGMTGGAYSGLVGIYNIISVPKNLLTEVGQEFGIHPIIIEAFYYVLFFFVVLGIILIIFNRVDAL